MHMKIERQLMDSTATLSHVTVDDQEFWGIEKPWRNNRSMVSCIPLGHYVLIPYKSPRYGNTWAFVGGSVSAKRSAASARFACLIHKGNYGKDVKGCLAIGSSPNYPWDTKKPSLLSVRASKVAFDKLMDMLEGEPYHTVSIDWA